MTFTRARRRVALAGMVTAACLLTLLARLVHLQVAERPAWAARSEANRARLVGVEAPRGRILDRDGRVLADHRPAYRVALDRALPNGLRRQVLARLAALLGVPEGDLVELLGDRRSSPLRPVPLADDVSEEVVVAIREWPERFPGVEIEPHPIRRYPHGTLAAHVLGTLGASGRGPGETGTSGVEAAFDVVLRGDPGVDRLEVDSRNRVVRRLGGRPPRPGRDVRLTLDLDVQAAAERALAEAMAAARAPVSEGAPAHPAPAGSVVALDVRDGSVLAMASAPTFDPSALAGRIRAEAWRALQDPAAHSPLTNRVLQGLYAPGSTFKPVTALAGLEAGVVSPGTMVDDRGAYRVGGRVFRNAGGRAHGPVDLARALAVSSGVYFYALGERLHEEAGDGPIQDVAHRLGLGQPTGVDIGPEAVGQVPGPESRREGRWYPGDTVNLAIGQGELLLTPLQLAVTYAALATGGRPVPRLVAPGPGAISARFRPPVDRIRAENESAVLAGLAAAVASPEGTAAAAFAGFPLDRVPVAGKTGTAQVTGKADTSLFAAVVPAGDPRYVVVAVIEEAGFGSAVAAPVVRRVIEALTG